jgi:hypothetical protein
MDISTATNYGALVARLTGSEPVHSDTVRGLEDALGVQLPDEFARICEFYESCGIGLGYLARVSAEPQGNTIVALTRRLRREQNLPPKYVVLGAADSSVLLLTGSLAPCEWSSVYEVPREALPEFTRGRTPLGTHRWPTFVDFFADAIGVDSWAQTGPRDLR